MFNNIYINIYIISKLIFQLNYYSNVKIKIIYSLHFSMFII